jgi:hypothetical protein
MKRLKKHPGTKHLLDFFTERNLNIRCLYYNKHQVLPNYLQIDWVYGLKFVEELMMKYSESIIYQNSNDHYDPRDKVIATSDIIVEFDSGEWLMADNHTLIYLYITEKLFSEAVLKIESRKYIASYSEPMMKMFVRDGEGLSTQYFPICKTDIDLNKNYNDDMISYYNNLIKELANEKKKGLHFLYGKPGTGKTNFLRHIISKVDRDVIFIPSGMTELLSDPTIFNLLSHNSGGILIIEDAEKAIVSRDSNRSDSVSTLLNISDGLLSDILKMQVICTFNTDITKLDKALLRPGRLLTKYEFKELELEKSKSLALELGLNKIITKPQTIAELYNDKESESIDFISRKVVGFN